MKIITWLLTKIRGQVIGTDLLGNTYYQDNRLRDNGKCRRWVVYNGQAEATKVPPQWHAWLHYVIDVPPTNEESYAWQQPHQRNLTGTKFAHQPSQWLQSKEERTPKEYEAWKPD